MAGKALCLAEMGNQPPKPNLSQEVAGSQYGKVVAGNGGGVGR